MPPQRYVSLGTCRQLLRAALAEPEFFEPKHRPCLEEPCEPLLLRRNNFCQPSQQRSHNWLWLRHAVYIAMFIQKTSRLWRPCAAGPSFEFCNILRNSWQPSSCPVSSVRNSCYKPYGNPLPAHLCHSHITTPSSKGPMSQP